MASTDEREIRDAVVARLRELLPDARIVHELNVSGTGSNRIDVAAIDAEVIVGVEIKSRKDVLKRLDEQWRAFSACCHHVIVAAHEKHFVADERANAHRRKDLPPVLSLNHPMFGSHGGCASRVWRYPRPEPESEWDKTWSFGYGFGNGRNPFRRQPGASAMLDMLWAEELRMEGGFGSRATRPDMINDMAWRMTGQQVCHAVCRQLRARAFAEADEPMGRDALAPLPEQGRLLA